MSAVNQHVFSHGMQDTRDTLDTWREGHWTVLRAWVALSVSIALCLLVLDGRKFFLAGAWIIDQLREQHRAARGKGPPGPPQMQRRRMPMPFRSPLDALSGHRYRWLVRTGRTVLLEHPGHVMG